MEEKILIQGTCNRIKGAFVENGYGLLTNQRLIYSKRILVNLTQGSYEFDIPLSDISSVQEKKRLFSKVLLITTTSGEEYSFYFTKLMEWKIHLSNLLPGKVV